MADQEFKIKVVSDADNSGFKSAAGAAKELDAQMGVLNVSQQDVDKILGKTGERAELTHLQFRRLANALGHDIPGAGALMEAGFTAAESGMLSSTFLLVAGVEMLRAAINQIDEEKKQSVKISDELADADAQHTDVIEKQREAVEKADVSEAEFYHNYLRNTQNAIDAAEKFASTLLKAESARNQSGDDKQKSVAENEVEQMEQRGVISHAAAVKAKEQIDIEYEQRKLIRQMAADAVEQSMAVNQLNNKQVATESLQRAEAGAEEKYKTAATAKAANDTKIDEANKKIAAGEDVKKTLRDTGVTEDSVQRLQDWFTQYTGKDASTTSLSEQFHALAVANVSSTDPRYMFGSLGREGKSLMSLFGSQGDRNLATYEGANIDITAGQSDLARYRKKSTDLDINEGNAKSDLDEARKELQKNKDEIAALQEQIKTTAATNAIKNTGAQSDLGMDKASAELGADKDIADQVKAGGNVGSADQQRLIAAASKIAGHAVDLETAATIIENGANSAGMFMAQVGRLATVLGNFTPGQAADLQRQIDALKNQMGSVSYSSH